MILMQIWMASLKNSLLETRDFLFYTQLLISKYHKDFPTLYIIYLLYSAYFFDENGRFPFYPSDSESTCNFKNIYF